ncbi:MAG TPA: FtsH protease activity modulator HflK [Acidobacteriota bacterium]|nr:FtsH protease activity modulator HflK [Acidobacteriota bacterium]
MDYIRSRRHDEESNLQKIKTIGKWIATGGAILGAGIAIATAAYKVPLGHQAVVQRFGKYHRTEIQGLKFKLPAPIETMTYVHVEGQHKIEIGYRTFSSGFLLDSNTIDAWNGQNVAEKEIRNFIVDAGYVPEQSNIVGQLKSIVTDEYRSVTGDKLISDIEFAIQYNITDPKAYLFNSENPRVLLRTTALQLMRRAAGDRSLDEVLMLDKEGLMGYVRRELPKVLNTYNIGITPAIVNLQDSDVPKPVRKAFQSLNVAQNEAQQEVNQATKDRNTTITSAQAQANLIKGESKEYYNEVTARVDGEITRYNSSYGEFAKSPELVRSKMYYEAMGKLLPKFERVLIADEKTPNTLWFSQGGTTNSGATNAIPAQTTNGDKK